MFVKLYFMIIFVVILIDGIHGCSIDVTESVGILTSPNYPALYDNRADYTYRIHSPQNTSIRLVFVDFHLEHDRSCSDDFIKINDGDGVDLGRFCGDSTPDPVLALSGTLVIHFHSDLSQRYKGFKAIYNDTTDYNGYTSTSNGVIQSPNYPRNYGSNQYCNFSLTSINALPINLTFTVFQLEELSSEGLCDYDYLEIVNDSHSIGKLCGSVNTPLTYTLSSNVLIKFHSDGTEGFKGFYAVFSEITPAVVTTETSITTRFFQDSTVKQTTSLVAIIIGTISGLIITTFAVVIIVWFLRNKHQHQLEPLKNDVYSISVINDHTKETDPNVYYNVESNGDALLYIATESPNFKNIGAAVEPVNILREPMNNSYSYFEINQMNSVGVNKRASESENDYIDQEYSYNILNMHPTKITGTKIYDRATEDVYDSARHDEQNNDQNLALYDNSKVLLDENITC